MIFRLEDMYATVTDVDGRQDERNINLPQSYIAQYFLKNRLESLARIPACEEI